MSDSLAPPVTDEEAAAAAAWDAEIDGGSPAPEPAQQSGPTPEQENNRDYEAEARADGWTSLEEWVAAGKDPEKHRDAQTFVELADNDPAVLRRKIVEARKQNEDFQKRITAATKAELDRVRRESEQRHQAEIQALEQERDQLIEQYAGDAASIRQINRNFEVAKANVAQPIPDVSLSWMAAHPEFNSDPVFNAVAVQICEQHKEKPFAEQLAIADKELSRRFPEYYSGAPTTQPAAKTAPTAPPANSRSIEGARTIQARGDRGFDSLPADAKAMFKMLEAEGLKPKKEDFAKDYYNG